MRSIWKGAITFGLVNVPVKVYSATEDHDISLHQVHDKDGGRIRYQRRCEVCGEVVDFKHIDKAYDDGEHTVVLTKDELKALPNTKVYLDGTHSAWLGTGEIANRLVKAGVQKADGFFLNVSNYELTERQLKYGSWVSQCIYYATEIEPGAYGSCAGQFYPASPTAVSTWGLTDAWYAQTVAGARNAPTSDDLAHFVIDTSRNGRGPWVPATTYPDPQVWCNPPARGLGYLPTSDTGHELADAFLWIKVPGESDGECSRGLTNNGGVDPAWGRVDPSAGAWFPEQALDLIRNASAPVRP